MTFTSVFGSALVTSALAWPLTIALASVATIFGITLPQRWHRLVAFCVAGLLAMSGGLGLWIVTHFQFGD